MIRDPQIVGDLLYLQYVATLSHVRLGRGQAAT
jgi:hypothetical protein